MMGQEPRQTTSNLGHLHKPSIQALIHGLNRHYYSLVINYRKNELEQKMLANLHKQKWTEGLKLVDFNEHRKTNEKLVKQLSDLAKSYEKSVREEEDVPKEKLIVQRVGKMDPKKHLEQTVQDVMSNNITQTLGSMLGAIVF
jgi:26S proteasome regulatory subunit N11